ncbi:MAG: GGDEF domain-containing protein [Meiothermus sp.]|nr:GGDEF domain-containing protein [Meiothermus sp.]
MRPASPLLVAAQNEDESLFSLKRLIYLSAMPLVVASGLVGWAFIDFGRGQENFYEAYSLPLFALAGAVCILLVWLGGRRGLRMGELGFFWVSSLLMTLNLYYNFLSISKDGLWTPILWMGCLFVVSHFVFESRQATRVSLLMFGVFLLAGTLALIQQPASVFLGQLNTLIQLYASLLTYLLVTRLLLALKERSALLHLEANRFFHLAHTDALTDTANRRSMIVAIEATLGRSRATGQPVSLILLDLDRFKQINDRYGHEVGDQVLVRVATQLKGHLRKTDLVGRWGGEEFVLLLPETPLEEAVRLAERLKAKLAEPSVDGLPDTSASFGVAQAVVEDDCDELVSRADRAMYLSKQSGGNRVVVETV